jgi:hypothetical protein
MASVTTRDESGAWRTAAPSHEAASAADQAQYEAQEGPCLDATKEPVVHTPSLPDPRWPRLATRPLDAGVRGVVSYRLPLDGPITDDSLGGSLNAYAATPDAFDQAAVEIGLILAAHASVAVRAIREREAVEQFSSDLHKALACRDVVGQAKGILMERLRITPDDAFDVLRRASQRLTVKLREIAQTLSETGELHQAGEVEYPGFKRGEGRHRPTGAPHCPSTGARMPHRAIPRGVLPRRRPAPDNW